MIFAGPTLITTKNWCYESQGYSRWGQSLKVLDSGAIEVKIELPGQDPQDISVDAQDGILSISLKSKLIRSYELSDLVDAENISAESKFGVLTVTLPMKPKASNRKVIPVRSALNSLSA
jgi:hypothetical protein